MKYIYKLICLSLIVLMISCVDDDKLRDLGDFPTGAIANLKQTNNDLGFIDVFGLDDIQIEIEVSFTNSSKQSDDGGLTSGGSGRESDNLAFNEVESVDLEVVWTDLSAGKQYHGTITKLTTFPSVVPISGPELIAAIPQLTSVDDLELGDNILIVGGVNLVNGTSLPGFVPNGTGGFTAGYSVNFTGSVNNPGIEISASYSVACGSPLGGIEVDYELLSATDAYGGSVPLTTGTFTWETGSSPTSFTWESYSWGTYESAYGCCEQGRDSGMEIIDTCQTLSITDDGYGCGWSLVVTSIAGPVIEFSLSGGCFGGVDIRMTRTDGLDWPVVM